MKKNITFGLLVIITVLSLTFGFYEKIRADRSALIAIKYQKIAEEEKLIAEMNAKQALIQKLRAEEQYQIAQRLKTTAKIKEDIINENSNGLFNEIQQAEKEYRQMQTALIEAKKAREAAEDLEK